MKMRINTNLYPRDGYVFKNPDGAIIRSTKGWKDLIARVRDYRRMNNMPPGDVENEVHVQACQNNPAYCYDASNVVTNVPNPPQRTLKSSVLAWLADVRRRKPEIQFVSAELAAARANICATCPFNKPLPSGGCSSCKAAIGEIRAQVLDRKKIDPRLHTCERLGVDNAMLAHMEHPTMENPNLPDHCWFKRK